MSARDDVVSALVVIESPSGLRCAAVWPAGAAAQGLEAAAGAAFEAGRRLDDPVPAGPLHAQGARRLLSKPLLSKGQAIGAIALAMRDPDGASRRPDDAAEEAPTQARSVPLPALIAARVAGSYRRSRTEPSDDDGDVALAEPPTTSPARATARSAPTSARASIGIDESAPTPARPAPEPAMAPAPPVATPVGPAARRSTGDTPATARLLELIGVALSQDDFERAATAVAGELCVALDADRVSIGLLEGRLIAVKAVSHGAQQRGQARELREIGAAMDEAADQSSTIRYPAMPEDRPLITLSHAELAQRQSAGALCTVPMVVDERVVGALTCERRAGRPFEDASVSLAEDAAAILGPLLELKREVERPVLSRVLREAARQLRRGVVPGYPRVRLTLAACVLALLALPLLPVDYRVTSPARLEGAVQRTLVAPGDGFLKQAHVRPGDAVKAGQVLAELADDDLHLERRRWESEVARHETAYAEAMARQDRAQVVIASARAAEARAQLDLVGQQITRARLVAPFDGVVLAGDLKQQLGAPVRRGDTLLTLAPAEQFRVIIEVEDREISRVRAGQPGEITLSARAHESYPVRVTRITPVSVAREGRNFFEVEATLAQGTPDMRPGLEGVAKLEAQRRSLYWVLGHRAVEWVRMAVWSWSR